MALIAMIQGHYSPRDNLTQLLPMADSRLEGLLPCPHNGCAFKCCTFDQGNFIVIHPGEFEAAQARGEHHNHLELIDSDILGGHRVVCRATDCATCDGGMKPLDCASYPLFPTAESLTDDLAPVIKGAKCPLPDEALHHHWTRIRARWREAAEGQPIVLEWLRRVKLVGYRLWDSQ